MQYSFSWFPITNSGRLVRGFNRRGCDCRKSRKGIFVQVEDFKESSAGRLVPISGHDAYLGKDYEHFAFVPAPLPARSTSAWERTSWRIKRACRLVASISLSNGYPILASLFVGAPTRGPRHVAQGTYATWREAGSGLRRGGESSAEVREVLNGVRAAEQAIESLGPSRSVSTSWHRSRATLWTRRVVTAGTRGGSGSPTFTSERDRGNRSIEVRAASVWRRTHQGCLGVGEVDSRRGRLSTPDQDRDGPLSVRDSTSVR